MFILRKYVNEKIIQSKPEVTAEILRQYQLKGRPDSIFVRAIMVSIIYVDKGIIHKSSNYDTDSYRARLRYPESCSCQPITANEWDNRLSGVQKVAFDAWYVLLQPLVDEGELLAFAETVTGKIGLQARIDYGQKLSDDEYESIQKIRCDLVLDNRYMHELLDRAIAMGKQIYVVDNLEYISKKTTRIILEQFGYKCEIISVARTKQDNMLYISTREKNSYKSVDCLGKPYRAWVKPNIISNIYDNIVNLHVHGSDEHRDIFYEYGYIYGGILTVGYCQFLNRLAKEKNIDKFLFVARDCYIIQQIYNQYFNEIGNSYFISSRFSGLELLFDLEPMEYVNENIRPRSWREKTDNSVGSILKECGLDFLEKYLSEYGLQSREELNDTNINHLTDVILDHRDEISDSFADSVLAATKYLEETIGDAHQIAIVDIGWRGRSYMYIKKFLKEVMNWTGESLGVLIGVWDNSSTLDYIREEEIKTFAFENTNGRNCGNQIYIPLDMDEIICIEALFSSEEDTLLRYKCYEDGNVGFIYGKENKNRDKIHQIHRGIMDFCETFIPMIKKYNLTITPRDAYTPLDSAMRNKTLKKMIREAYEELPGAINGF